ncbi:binding-protein-dependent transport systems inner membrane component [Halothece sp. PCC 7418]|uniref:ABC transporter permease n=1 Tax=Halothece sp. (strain PCC 7418) TaxID=65093 RepID=UPI0002A06EC0|nr:ABC transporter permease [Halothece sp. PCC 7418]AFZ45453.1 binding-protein-dependent transport systems inner membrane component [Halothece sp. PCC 7418]
MTQFVSKNQRHLKPSVFWSIRQGFPKWLDLTLTVTALVIPLLLWCLLSYGGFVDSRFLPAPTTVLQAGIQMLTEGELLTDILASSGRVLAGFFLAAVIGIPIGIASGTFYSMESLFGSFIGVVRYMPVAAFMPLIVLWVGLGEPAKILIVFLGVIFYNAIMIADTVKFIPSEMLNTAYTLGANRKDLLWRVILPASLPGIFDTLRVNIAGAWNFLVISELIAAQNGLGFKIVYYQRFLQTDRVLFCILIIGLIGLTLDYFFKLLARLTLPWAESTSN